MKEIKNNLDEFFFYIPENYNECNKTVCQYCDYFKGFKKFNPLICSQREKFLDEKFNKKDLCMPT